MCRYFSNKLKNRYLTLTLMRSAPKKLFKFLKNPNFLNISLDIPGGPRGPRGPWRVLEAPGNLCRSLEVPGGPRRFLEVLGDS